MKKVYSFLVFFYAFNANCYAVSINTDEPRLIVADKIEYNAKSEEIKTVGNTEITNKSGQRMTLTDSYISQRSGGIVGTDIHIWLGQHVYIESADVERDGDLTVVHDATFTACANCDSYGDAWDVWARKIVHNADARMLSFYSPVFYTYEIPVFWMPYISMPDPGVKYKTGLLVPDMGSTNKMGTKINIPLYISLSETHDMTFTFGY